MPRGAFIVFEGADRSGKTTQTKRLTSALRSAGIPLATDSPWAFPDRSTAVGKMINAYLTSASDLDDCALHLLFSANRWEKVAKIHAALEVGETVIVDRYAFSGVAYSVAKGLDAEWCKGPDAGLPAPDVVLYLDLSPESAVKRGHYGKERYENDAMQRAVAKEFHKLQDDKWKVVDADADPDTVFARISDAVMPIIATARETDTLQALW